MTDYTIHYTVEEDADTSVPDIHQDTFSKGLLGFWLYIITDCILFTSLFITYAVLHPNTFGGPSSKDLFSLSVAYRDTIILLCSSISCGMAVIAAKNNQTRHIFLWLLATFTLGGLFITSELVEFKHLVDGGNSWERSGFLSSYFMLVGAHGLHITTGLFWIIVMIGQLFAQGLNADTFRRLVLFSIFWHFLDLIWIFIFTFVYLMGVL